MQRKGPCVFLRERIEMGVGGFKWFGRGKVGFALNQRETKNYGLGHLRSAGLAGKLATSGDRLMQGHKIQSEQLYIFSIIEK